MSLAENLINSLDNYETSEIYNIEEEPHIIVGENRVITVPQKLKLIAVKGDKDIETVTFDCVRYWDEHDLSTFAIYLNYILPNGDEGTYIPTIKSRSEDTFSFDWTIGEEITAYTGKLVFWIVAKTTDDAGNLLYQWSSLQNSKCTIEQGGSKIFVPEKQTDQDVITQVLAVSTESAKRAEEAAQRAESACPVIEQTTGTSETSVMSQKAVCENFSNVLKGSKSGYAVVLDDVSPIAHTLKISGLTFDVVTADIYKFGKNLLSPETFNLPDIGWQPCESDYFGNTGNEMYCGTVGELTKYYKNKSLFDKFAPNTQYTIAVKFSTIPDKFNINTLGFQFSYTDGTTGMKFPVQTDPSQVIFSFTSAEDKTVKGLYLRAYLEGFAYLCDAQLFVGSLGSYYDYEPYKEPEVYHLEANGTHGLPRAFEFDFGAPIYPKTTLEFVPENHMDYGTITTQYNRDINKAFDELKNAIISLGGNV